MSQSRLALLHFETGGAAGVPTGADGALAAAGLAVAGLDAFGFGATGFVAAGADVIGVAGAEDDLNMAKVSVPPATTSRPAIIMRRFAATAGFDAAAAGAAGDGGGATATTTGSTGSAPTA